MPWQSSNQDDVRRDIEDGLRTRRYKDCTHLHIAGYYQTACKEDSLVYPDRGGYEYSPDGKAPLSAFLP